ncbi:thioredoxin [Herbiconiux sp. P15]|uniref:thioredoxin n=1 Tax=Herbiconiux liukaitaii TaxID=3342799 RepID=UPI0035B9D8E0
MSTKTLTIDNHDETVADGIVLIDFWADWCGPCKQFAPVFEKASTEHSDIVFAKVDTEDQQQLAASYGITSIPTLVGYRDGIPIFAQPGALPGTVLEDVIKQVRGLDMETVKKEYAEAVAAQPQQATTPSPDAI